MQGLRAAMACRASRCYWQCWMEATRCPPRVSHRAEREQTLSRVRDAQVPRAPSELKGGINQPVISSSSGESPRPPLPCLPTSSPPHDSTSPPRLWSTANPPAAAPAGESPADIMALGQASISLQVRERDRRQPVGSSLPRMQCSLGHALRKGKDGCAVLQRKASPLPLPYQPTDGPESPSGRLPCHTRGIQPCLCSAMC